MFRLYIEKLINNGHTVKKPGRPPLTDNSPRSNPTASKRMWQEYRPITQWTEVRLDGIGQFPDFDDKPTHSQTSCKFPNCAGKHIFCIKCLQKKYFLVYHSK